MKLSSLRSLTVVVVLLAVLVATPVFGGNRNSERGRPDATLEQSSDDLDPELRQAFQAFLSALYLLPLWPIFRHLSVQEAESWLRADL